MENFDRYCSKCGTGYLSATCKSCPECTHPGFRREPIVIPELATEIVNHLIDESGQPGPISLQTAQPDSVPTGPVGNVSPQQNGPGKIDRNLEISNAYLGAIAHFLKALWFVTLSAIFGVWASSQYSAKILEIADQCGGYSSDCFGQSSPFGFWVVPAIASFVVFLFAGSAGREALLRLNRAG